MCEGLTNFAQAAMFAPMNSDEANKRLVLSRHTLGRYRSMPGGTNDSPEWLLGQIRQEIEVLEGILARRPESAGIASLIEQWREFAQAQRVRGH